jgi:hypothetical protein
MIILIILGIILVVTSFTLKPIKIHYLNFQISLKSWSFVNCWGIFSSAFKQIDAGTVGVTTLYGNVQTGILTSGLNVINPLLDVVDFDIRTQNYTMSSSQNEGDQFGDDAIRVLSNDGLEVVIDLTVLYRVSAVDAQEF